MASSGKNNKVPQQKRRAMMHSIGYILHPELPEGRLPYVTVGDGGRPRLYVLAGSEAAKVTGAEFIHKHYSESQTPKEAPV